ncbi:MAG: putative lipid II flippase FtsW [Rhodospirillaceae bacterium]|jgi:cell division protein FtsW|nr:putative lipid II flippase FtsW [Rhodospirillaceae bacterium]
MTIFKRTDTSLISNWYWTIDLLTLIAIILLIAIGIILNLTASPSVAERIGANYSYFIFHQLALLPLTILVIFGVSLITLKNIHTLTFIIFLISIILMVATLFFGQEIKGATRWITFAGISIQPSEFAKPTFAVIIAWLFSKQHLSKTLGNLISFGLFLLVAYLLLLQPDFGMTLVISAVWFTEFLISGLPLILILMIITVGLIGGICAYLTFSHVTNRIDQFFDKSIGDNYQITTALHAFNHGGFFGRGPGEGRVKTILPDAHTDFIMAVAGEEFGLILCLIIVGIFTFIIIRSFTRILTEENLFVFLATSGILVQFGLQAIINMASTLHLIPTKGMTLPFISYGGSSMLSLALGMGIMLSLTRKRYCNES